MGNCVPLKWKSIMSQTVEQDKLYEIATSALLSESISEEESGLVGWQLKASAALFDIPEW